MSLGDLIEAEDTSMILVMGLTGSGKSRFINTIVQGATVECSGLQPGTDECQLVQAKIGEDRSIAIVDTPGFDDPGRSDAEILSKIATFATARYLNGIPLRGIIYLHRITDLRMQGGALRNFQMFQEICGKHALGNVVILTTMWDKLINEEEGYRRQRQLRRDFWSTMEEAGSLIDRFYGTKESAEFFIASLLGKGPVVLEIEKELGQEGKLLGQTVAGQRLFREVEVELSEKDKRIKSLEEQIRKATLSNDTLGRERLEDQKSIVEEQKTRDEEQRAKLREGIGSRIKARIKHEKQQFDWREGLKMFATITGVIVSIVSGVFAIVG